MTEVIFTLKTAAPTTGLSLIILRYRIHGGGRLVYSTGQSIPPALWSKARQSVKSTALTSDGLSYINDLLSNMRKIVLNAYLKESVNGFPTVGQLRQYLDEFMDRNLKKEAEEAQKLTLYDLFDRIISNEIICNGKARTQNTRKNYTSTLNHLKAFEKKEKYMLTFESITLDFFQRFLQYLKNQGVGINTTGKYLTTLKVVMNLAVDEFGLTENKAFRQKSWKIMETRTEAVFLNMEELGKIYSLDLSTNPRLDRVRDTFVAACNLGLRYSDIVSLKAENFRTMAGMKVVIKRTIKTDEEVIIPCSPTLLEIFEKYKPCYLPKPISGPCFNRYIKEVCKLAGLTETGRLLTDPQKKLCDCIGTHTARRSFATNHFLSGFPVSQLKKILGHRTDRAFETYIKISNIQVAQNLYKHMGENLSKKNLKIA